MKDLGKRWCEMDLDEAREWLSGNRSLRNFIPSDPQGAWQAIVAEADAAMIQQAYWIARAHKEGLVEGGRDGV